MRVRIEAADTGCSGLEPFDPMLGPTREMLVDMSDYPGNVLVAGGLNKQPVGLTYRPRLLGVVP